MDPKIAAGIAAIPRHSLDLVSRPRVPSGTIQLRCWAPDAQTAEVPSTAFTSAKKGQALTTARLIVRRVRDQNKQAAAGQDELFPAWRYHAVFSDSPVELVQAEEQHRDHAIVEQVFAELDRRAAGAPAVRGLPGERRLADLRRYRAQPAARRRIPGQPRLRQGPRRHHPPRPHRRRRPHRPGRGAHHAAPARSRHREHELDDPVHRYLRPTPHSGLTSPDPVTAPASPTRLTDPAIRPGITDRPQEQ